MFWFGPNQLMDDVPAYGVPAGRTARKPPAPSVSVTVSVAETAFAPKGTTGLAPFGPTTDTLRSAPSASLPSPPRESYTRAGEMAWNAPADVRPASFRHFPGSPLSTQTKRLP